MKRFTSVIASLPAGTIVLAIRCYQLTISPLLGQNCRYTPSCSSYFIAAVKKHGVIRGSCRGVGRILRCHPFSRGGYDPP